MTDLSGEARDVPAAEPTDPRPAPATVNLDAIRNRWDALQTEVTVDTSDRWELLLAVQEAGRAALDSARDVPTLLDEIERLRAAAPATVDGADLRATIYDQIEDLWTQHDGDPDGGYWLCDVSADNLADRLSAALTAAGWPDSYQPDNPHVAAAREARADVERLRDFREQVIAIVGDDPPFETDEQVLDALQFGADAFANDTLQWAKLKRERDEATADLFKLWDAAGIPRPPAHDHVTRDGEGIDVDYVAASIRGLVDTARVARTQLRPQLARAQADADDLRAEIDRLKVEASNYAHDRDAEQSYRAGTRKALLRVGDVLTIPPDDDIDAYADLVVGRVISDAMALSTAARERDAERERADQLAREVARIADEIKRYAGPVTRGLANDLRALLDGTASPASSPTALDHAMHSVWLHGKWRWLTRNMTTEEREAASDAVDRVGEWIGRDDGEEREPIDRWWRTSSPTADPTPAACTCPWGQDPTRPVRGHHRNCPTLRDPHGPEDGCPESGHFDWSTPDPAPAVDLMAALRASLEAAKARRLSADPATPACPDCGEPHDLAACIRDGATSCDCCRAITDATETGADQ